MIIENQERIVRPIFYRLGDEEDRLALDSLRSEGKVLFENNHIEGQIRELIQLSEPGRKFSELELKDAVASQLNGCTLDEYGVYVYYPWSGTLVHLLDEEEFVRVRTDRNRYKITAEEQERLSRLKVGIVGLSVGQSVCLTMAMQRCFGELRIADFDSLELSNMNRIRTGVSSLGLPKITITAREIAEIDPFLKVKCYWEGLQEDNLDAFMSEGGQLDVFIDECDDLRMKVLSRQTAKSRSIPVVMETSDRGMLDVERFDIEPNRELFHGVLGSFENIVEKLKENPMAVATTIMDLSKVSERGMRSLGEMGKSLSAWPQLAEDVMLGGATATKAVRNIGLGLPLDSGRYYIDVNEIISTK